MFFKKAVASRSNYCNLGYIQWVEMPVLVKKIFEQEYNKLWPDVSLKMPKNEPLKIISFVLFIA